MPNSSDTITPLPYGRQTVGQEEIDAVIEVLKSPFLTQGPAIAQFEQAVADYCNVQYAVAFANGTAALHAACFAADMASGDEAIVPPITFVATSNAVLYCDAKPVFADIDGKSWNLALEKAAKAITSRTKALMPVHFAGQPVDLDAFYALADKYNLTVIEDACHALGASYHGKPIGQCRDMAIFSFHPVKSITTGEGGMVVTPHKHFYEKLLRFRSHGLNRDASQFTHLDGAPWEYEMQSLGYNYRLTDLQAAMGVAQLQKLPDFVQHRQALVDRYVAAFSKISGIQVQTHLPQTQSAHHLFVITLSPDWSQFNRKDLYQSLAKQGINCQVHYIPVHLHPYYQENLGYKPGDFPIAESYYARALSLPLYPTLSFEDQDRVITAIHQQFIG